MSYQSMATLKLVKTRLNRLDGDTSMDDYLTARIDAAVQEMERCGIHLQDTSTDDMMLCVDTVVWQYQCRDKSGGMPEWLRLRRRERWLKERDT